MINGFDAKACVGGKHINVNNDNIKLVKGEKGDPFKYEDFTPEQLEALKGKDGKDGNDYVVTENDYELIAEKSAEKLQPTISELDAYKVGYSEVVNNQLIMYADATKEKILATLDLPGGGVTDVQINGESIVTDGVSNIYISSTGSGLKYDKGNGLRVTASSDTQINDRSNKTNPVVPKNLDYAVKAAMCDGKGEAWTADEQAAARERMAVENGSDFELLVDAVLGEEANKFTVTFPKPVRECLYHIWFFNNNGENANLRTYCLEVGTNKYCMLKYSAGIKDGCGYVLNGYFRYNGEITSRSIVGYAAESSVASWTSDINGNGNVAYMNYPTDTALRKVDGIQIFLNNASHVLNAGAVIKVWGR